MGDDRKRTSDERFAVDVAETRGTLNVPCHRYVVLDFNGGRHGANDVEPVTPSLRRTTKSVLRLKQNGGFSYGVDQCNVAMQFRQPEKFPCLRKAARPLYRHLQYARRLSPRSRGHANFEIVLADHFVCPGCRNRSLRTRCSAGHRYNCTHFGVEHRPPPVNTA